MSLNSRTTARFTMRAKLLVVLHSYLNESPNEFHLELSNLYPVDKSGHQTPPWSLAEELLLEEEEEKKKKEKEKKSHL